MSPFSLCSPLWEAAAAGHTDTVQALLAGGADADKGFALGPVGLLVRRLALGFSSCFSSARDSLRLAQ